MKTKFFVLIFAAVMMAACGGSGSGSAEQSGCQSAQEGCKKETGEGCCASRAAADGCSSTAEGCKGAGKCGMKKVISAQVFIKTEKVDEFLALTVDLIEKSLAEEGCISYSLFQDPNDKTAFLFFEEWKNQAAVDFHFETEHFASFGAFLEEAAAKPPVITVFSSVCEEKL